jgi:hypothetical protein
LKTRGEPAHLFTSFIGKLHIRRPGEAIFRREDGRAVPYQEDSSVHGAEREASGLPVQTVSNNKKPRPSSVAEINGAVGDRFPTPFVFVNEHRPPQRSNI